MTYQSRLYLNGLAAAGLSGGANAITVLIVDPVKFNFDGTEGVKSLIIAVLVSALVGFATYVKQHPLPDPAKDTDAPSVSQSMVEAVAAKQAGTTPNLISKEVRDLAAQIVSGTGDGTLKP